MLFSHGSFRKPALSPVFCGFLERRIPGKNREGAPRSTPVDSDVQVQAYMEAMAEMEDRLKREHATAGTPLAQSKALSGQEGHG